LDGLAHNHSGTLILAILLIVSGVFLLVPAIQKAVKERAVQRTAGATARNVWARGSDEQRKAMLDFIDITEGSYRDSLLKKSWDELPESVRVSTAKNFRRL
jgi:UPF0716 family protein affecting phage T7 exclusion